MNQEKKHFYKAALLLIIPLALQNLVNVAVVGTDVIMLGRVGEEALSGVSLGGQRYFILSMFLFVLTSVVPVLAFPCFGIGVVISIYLIFGLYINIAS